LEFAESREIARTIERMTTPRRVAIVTGASSGIGRETALLLARHGWTVALVSRRASELSVLKQQIKAAGGIAIAIPGDVTKPKDIDHIVAETQAIGGRIDALLNIAGIGGMASVMTADDKVQEMLDTNLLAPIRLMRAVIPIMRAQRGGAIVNVGSVKGEIAISGIYTATKFGLRGLTGSVRRELAGTGIHVSLVEPGYIATAMTAHRGGRMPGADVVAAAIETCLTRSRRRVVVPGYYRPLIWISNLFPWAVDRRYNGRIGNLS
jgi:NAD(P)-dependent dehydrogenase (short-subunit alcohol dehydrogenase family)